MLLTSLQYLLRNIRMNTLILGGTITITYHRKILKQTYPRKESNKLTLESEQTYPR